MEILRIEPTNEHFAQAGDLRERVLLRAVGFTLAQFDEVYGSADRFDHFIALGDADDGEWAERVMGVALLLPEYPEPGCGKIMQVAVEEGLRGRGVGAAVMRAAEDRAFAAKDADGRGLASLVCHAQLPAVPFYERIGWSVISEEFEEAGIPHLRMAKWPK